MVQKTVWLPELGELTLSKRRGARNLRITITPAGKLRVAMPMWAPYSAGISFALSRRQWIKQHRPAAQSSLAHGSRVGKSYRLEYIRRGGDKTVTAKVGGGVISIFSALPFDDGKVQQKAQEASEKALKKEAQALLPQRLDSLAGRHDFSYKSLKVRKLTSRWGSCSSRQVITLNYYLMQLPWRLIDYVILHELLHTRHLNHGRAFWDDFTKIEPQAKQLRKEIRGYRPVLAPLAPDVP